MEYCEVTCENCGCYFDLNEVFATTVEDTGNPAPEYVLCPDCGAQYYGVPV